MAAFYECHYSKEKVSLLSYYLTKGSKQQTSRPPGADLGVVVVKQVT